jgi:hypothetical protein
MGTLVSRERLETIVDAIMRKHLSEMPLAELEAILDRRRWESL